MSGTRGLPKSDMKHTVPSLKALILYVGKKDVSVKTELEQESHGVPLPTLPFLPEFTHDIGLHGALNAEPYFSSFLFLETLAIPFSHSKFLFFECSLCARAGHPASAFTGFLSLDSS